MAKKAKKNKKDKATEEGGSATADPTVATVSLGNVAPVEKPARKNGKGKAKVAQATELQPKIATDRPPCYLFLFMTVLISTSLIYVPIFIHYGVCMLSERACTTCVWCACLRAVTPR